MKLIMNNCGGSLLSKSRASEQSWVPSTLSLHKYFSSMESEDELGNDLGGLDYPELDKQFVMPSKLAHEILVRKITPAEFARQRRLRHFWSLPSKATGISTTIVGYLLDDLDGVAAEEE